MRAIFLTSLLVAAQAFQAPVCYKMSTALRSSDTHIDPQFTAGSGMDVDALPMFIDNLNQENFLESLEMMEPLFTNECVGDECDLLLGKLEEKCDKIGKKLPEGYAATHH
jgi:hypothetical protein